MLKVLITPPVPEFSARLGHNWYVSVKQDFKKPAMQLGYLFKFQVRPTQRQVRWAKKVAKAAFREHLNRRKP